MKYPQVTRITSRLPFSFVPQNHFSQVTSFMHIHKAWQQHTIILFPNTFVKISATIIFLEVVPNMGKERHKVLIFNFIKVIF